MFEIGKLGRLTLGYVNENEARVIDIDMTGWLEDYPDGNIGLLVKRPWEDNYYPADLKREGNIVIWKPTRADMMIDGEGEAQFVLTNAEGVELRSRVVGTKINASLGGTAGDKPNPADSFVQTVINAAAQAEAAVEKMPSIGENGNWYAWDAAAGEYVDTGKPSKGKDGLDGDPGYTPQKGIDYFDGKDGEDGYTPVKGKDYFDGEDGYTPVKGKDYFDGEPGYTPVKGKDYHDGQDGISPTVKVQEITNGHRVTITDRNGSQSFDVLDGELKGDVPAGADGGYYQPSVSDDGILSWSASKADMPSVASANIKGPAGVRGPAGSPGKDGSAGRDGQDGASVTVTNVTTSDADGGTNVVTFSDGKTLNVRNGSKGSPGKDGSDGRDGQDGAPGKDGTSVTVANVSESTADGGTNVVTFSDGKKLNVRNGSKGSDGAPGPAGSDGAPGRTPVKGTDYFTAADKQSIVNDALAALAGADPSDAGYAELKGRTSKLETKVTNIAEDIASLQQDVDELETSYVETIIKVIMRLVQLERHLGLQPPVSDDMDTNVGVEGSYDELFGQN